MNSRCGDYKIQWIIECVKTIKKCIKIIEIIIGRDWVHHDKLLEELVEAAMEILSHVDFDGGGTVEVNEFVDWCVKAWLCSALCRGG